MREIIEIEADEQEKCSMCQFRFSTLYRFEDEDEDHAVCGDCFLQYILEEDIQVADDGELIVSNIISELIEHALAELSTGELDELENTLHSINDQLPADSTPATTNA